MRFAAGLLATLALTTAASAADLIIEQPPVFVPPPATWDGAYIGIHAGGADGTETDNQSEFYEDIAQPADTFDLTGWLIGLHAGANVQMDNFVLGVEGVVDLTDVNGSADYEYGRGATGTLSFSSNWQASLNARAGVAIDALLLYGSVGVAFAEGTLTDEPDFGSTYEDTATHIGWTVAAGLEYMFDENWSGRVEARYSDFGDADYDLGFKDGDVTAGFTQTALTVGLSYGF